jgi:hypothetical protein
MRRKLFNLAAGASLLVCVFVAALWLRSYWSADRVSWMRFWYDGTVSRVYENPKHFESWSVHDVVLDSERGGLRLFYYSDRGRDGFFNPQRSGFEIRSEPSSRYPYSAMSGLRPALMWTWGGFQVHHEQESNRTGRVRWLHLVAPHWSVAGVAAVMPALWAYHYRRLRRHEAGHVCAHCGYDLRATPGRCPECGAAPGRRTAA